VGVKYISSGLGAILSRIFPIWIVIITFFRGEKTIKLSHSRLVIAFCRRCVIFYEHLNDLLIPDFRFGIILLTLSTISGLLVVYIPRKKRLFNFIFF
jgi:hypothetical protein